MTRCLQDHWILVFQKAWDVTYEAADKGEEENLGGRIGNDNFVTHEWELACGASGEGRGTMRGLVS